VINSADVRPFCGNVPQADLDDLRDRDELAALEFLTK
jgi:hypothetical protein